MSTAVSCQLPPNGSQEGDVRVTAYSESDSQNELRDSLKRLSESLLMTIKKNQRQEAAAEKQSAMLEQKVAEQTAEIGRLNAQLQRALPALMKAPDAQIVAPPEHEPDRNVRRRLDQVRQLGVHNAGT